MSGRAAQRLRGMPAHPVIGVGLFSWQFGGSERVGVDLALAFHRRGFKVVCFALHDSAGPMRAELEAAGVRCLEVNYDRWRGPLRYPRYLWAMWRTLRREGITALHLHHHGALVLCGPPAALAGIAHVVMTEHGLQSLEAYPAARRLARFFGHYASDITVVEPGQAEYFHRTLKVSRAKLHCIANGVLPTVDREPARALGRARLGLDPATFVFGYVGRLDPVKDLGTLLAAFARLPPGVAGLHLCLIGEGSERASLETRAAQLGIAPRVRFCGSRSDVTEVLTALDSLVLSSRSEGLPMVLLEAMAASVPCIATAVGGIPGLLADERGLLVPPGDPAALAAAMTALRSDPALGQRLAQRARAHVRERYALEPIVDRYLTLLGLPPQCGGLERGELRRHSRISPGAG